MRIIFIANNIFIKEEMIDKLNIQQDDKIILFGKYELNLYNKVIQLTNNIFLFLRGRSRNNEFKWQNYFKQHKGQFKKIYFVSNHLNKSVQENINKTIINEKSPINEKPTSEIIFKEDLYNKCFDKEFNNEEPTTGLIALEYFINKKENNNIILLGFTQEKRHGDSLWSGHNGNLEKEIINNLVKEKKITKFYCTKIKIDNILPNIKLKKVERLKLEYTLICGNE